MYATPKPVNARSHVTIKLENAVSYENFPLNFFAGVRE